MAGRNLYLENTLRKRDQDRKIPGPIEINFNHLRTTFNCNRRSKWTGGFSLWYYDLRLEMRLNDMCRWALLLNRLTSPDLCFRCLVFLPCTCLRHLRKLDGFRLRRIKVITAASDKPNWASIASKGVRSSQAISMTRFFSRSVSVFMLSRNPDWEEIVKP